jgi:serine phosphatase RsbU (regulator of sigma subunit)
MVALTDPEGEATISQAPNTGGDMETLELNSGDEIRDFVSTRLHALLDSFSILNVGYITKFVEPINCNLRISEALQMFASREDVNSLPVEGDRGVMGIIHKKDVLQKKTALMSVTDPPVERFLGHSTFTVDASENCEKTMGLILSRDPEKLYDDFMIYEHGRFFGIGTFADLSRNIAAIRNVDLDKARSMQEFLMARNVVAGTGITVERYIKMAHAIGGDYTQCMDINDELSLLSCYDVCGKGTAAALLTSILSSFFSTLKVCGTLPALSPSSILTTLNTVIMDQTPEEIFVAGVLVFIDRAKREVTFYNCGFSPLYVFYTDEEEGKTRGKIINPDLWPLGINEFSDPQGSTFPIYKNFRVFLNSDGLTDARDERGEQYGEENLRKFLYPRCMKKAQVIVSELDKEISSFIASAPQADDITVLVAEIS